MKPTMNIRQIIEAGRSVVKLIHQYSTVHGVKSERRQDPLLFGYFEARFGDMQRQWQIQIAGGTRRVDFRHGGSNPVLIEFAIRPPTGACELNGPQNRAEINKLTRFTPAQARLRVLLLLDLAPAPIPRERLKATYDEVRASRGNYRQSPVRVVYVHPDLQYDFIWSGAHGKRRS